MKLTHAGKQIERALADGYEVAAFNLYADAMDTHTPLNEPEDESDPEAEEVGRWHRSTQERIGWKARVAEQRRDGLRPSLRHAPYKRNDHGEVTGKGKGFVGRLARRLGRAERRAHRARPAERKK